jgi:VanZ family protein
LLSAWLFRLRPDPPDWKAILSTTILAIALIGGLDEYHQTFTPGRSGNDPYDWLADVLGAAAGAFAFKRFHHRLK